MCIILATIAIAIIDLCSIYTTIIKISNYLSIHVNLYYYKALHVHQ